MVGLTSFLLSRFLWCVLRLMLAFFRSSWDKVLYSNGWDRMRGEERGCHPFEEVELN